MKVSESMLKAVIDTNVLISAALSSNSRPAYLVTFFIKHGRVVFSEETYEEFYSRLWRPKFDPYISRKMRTALLNDFSNIAEWIKPEHSLSLCRDEDDNKFLELAVSAKVDFLVSGDTDLTVLKEVEGIPILTPAQCLLTIEHEK